MGTDTHGLLSRCCFYVFWTTCCVADLCLSSFNQLLAVPLLGLHQIEEHSSGHPPRSAIRRGMYASTQMNMLID